MTISEKKLNQILNLVQLIHEENIISLRIMNTMVQSKEEHKAFEDTIDRYERVRDSIISGMYEDEIDITH